MIVGTIYDSSTTEPISGVRVQTLPPTHRACSGVGGTYRIEGTDPELAEVYRVFFFKPGYEPMEFAISVRTGRTGDARTADAHLRADTATPDACEPTPPQPPLQGPVITGRVFDDRTLRPLAGVRVSTTPTSDGAVTDDMGLYAIEGVAEGSYEVRAQSRTWFMPDPYPVRVLGDRAYFIDLPVERRPRPVTPKDSDTDEDGPR